MLRSTILRPADPRRPGQRTNAYRRRTHVLLWSVQALLALIFLSTGGSKLTISAAQRTQLSDLPTSFLRCIGVCEALGALGLLLPAIVRNRLRQAQAAHLTRRKASHDNRAVVSRPWIRS